ncbi:unnamed protein product [Oikopleura dioica]|uniref:Uncharacterized protein n=1 Tax=Oikopleura dioica TaxID=34765 RepID=E4X8W9_OIKDI|nr:unnamed protein product [Oikopleura dioica]
MIHTLNKILSCKRMKALSFWHLRRIRDLYKVLSFVFFRFVSFLYGFLLGIYIAFEMIELKKRALFVIIIGSFFCGFATCRVVYNKRLRMPKDLLKDLEDSTPSRRGSRDSAYQSDRDDKRED